MTRPLQFITETGSVYELDRTKQMMRRMSGEDRPTPNQGEDGVWKPYGAITEVKVGVPVLVTWGWDDEGILHRTITSPVMVIPQQKEET